MTVWRGARTDRDDFSYLSLSPFEPPSYALYVRFSSLSLSFPNRFQLASNSPLSYSDSLLFLFFFSALVHSLPDPFIRFALRTVRTRRRKRAPPPLSMHARGASKNVPPNDGVVGLGEFPEFFAPESGPKRGRLIGGRGGRVGKAWSSR